MPVVAALLQDPDSEVRQQAAEALGKVGDENMLDQLVVAMMDEQMGVRQAAARAAAMLDPYWERQERVQALVPRIEAALRHRDPGVQYIASGLLRRITGRRAADSAIALAYPGSGWKPDRVVGILEDLMHDPDEEVRLAAAEAVGRLRLTPCATGLRAALKDSSDWVKLAARQALAALNQPHGPSSRT
jgi:HEAT repeat protein